MSQRTVSSTETKPKPTFSPPTYTIRDVQNAIPRHCYERSTARTLGYVARDLFFIVALATLATFCIPKLPRTGYYDNAQQFAAWTAYAILQSFCFTGIWEIAHQAGHQALSPTKWVNYALGMVLHSALLVPFHSWRVTHATHHKTTNNMERDIAFVPDFEDVWLAKRSARGWFMKMTELFEDVPLVSEVSPFNHYVNFSLTLAPRLYWQS